MPPARKPKPRPDRVERLPWEKQRGESAVAFTAFALYRDLGAQRSCAKVGQALGRATGTMERYSSKHHWVERAEAYDAYLDRRRLEATQESWRVAAAGHVAIVGNVRQALAAKLTGDAQRNITALNPDDLEWGDISRLMRDTVTLERAIHGQPSDIANRVLQIDVNQAISHLRTVIELARRHMDTDQFRGFILDYRAATGAALEDARGLQQLAPVQEEGA